MDAKPLIRGISWTGIVAVLGWMIGGTWWLASLNAEVVENERAIAETNHDVAAINKERPFERLTTVETRLEDVVRWFAQPAAEKSK